MHSRNRMVKKYLKGPEGYAMSEAVEWHDLPELKRTALAMIDPNDPQRRNKIEAVNKWNMGDIRKFFKFNGFTFVKNPKEVVDVQSNNPEPRV